MRYDVVFTDRARDDLEEVVEYLITEFCNKQAVEHLLLCVDNVLDNLISQFFVLKGIELQLFQKPNMF